MNEAMGEDGVLCGEGEGDGCYSDARATAQRGRPRGWRHHWANAPPTKETGLTKNKNEELKGEGDEKGESGRGRADGRAKWPEGEEP